MPTREGAEEAGVEAIEAEAEGIVTAKEEAGVAAVVAETAVEAIEAEAEGNVTAASSVEAVVAPMAAMAPSVAAPAAVTEATHALPRQMAPHEILARTKPPADAHAALLRPPAGKNRKTPLAMHAAPRPGAATPPPNRPKRAADEQAGRPTIDFRKDRAEGTVAPTNRRRLPRKPDWRRDRSRRDMATLAIPLAKARTEGPGPPRTSSMPTDAFSAAIVQPWS